MCGWRATVSRKQEDRRRIVFATGSPVEIAMSRLLKYWPVAAYVLAVCLRTCLDIGIKLARTERIRAARLHWNLLSLILTHVAFSLIPFAAVYWKMAE